MRKGQIAAEGYWAPFTEDSMHRMYSISKSFVSMAIGLMIDEGKIHLDDQVVKFFEDKVPQDIHPYLVQATIRDLLMMSTPHSTNSYSREDSDWAATFFHKQPSHPPGTVFSYDTAATVVLNTIVERISGVPFLEYMRPKLLDPIGFTKDAWCVKTPEGTSWGGSGVICKLRDMAKLAYVCLNKGRWNGSQLISEEYITAATSKQIDNSILGSFGYGYQIWRHKDNGFNFWGMGSQYGFCFPEKDLLFACISDTQGSEPDIPGIFRDEVYCKVADSPLPDDEQACIELKEKIKSLQVLPQRGDSTSPFVEKVNARWFSLEENPMQISRMRLIFEGEEGTWEYENATGHRTLRFGIGKTIQGLFPETHYFGERIGTPLGRGYQCLSSAAWVEEHKLNMLVNITDFYLGSLKASFSFKDNQISIFMTKAAEWFLDEYSGFAGGVLE
jgi:CubicO group peptidase (beta-lactamase class C family)